MTLTTRCPECHTTFKVVSDQLKVSNGWVRCGRCQAVFDAAPHLAMLDAGEMPNESGNEPSTEFNSSLSNLQQLEPGLEVAAPGEVAASTTHGGAHGELDNGLMQAPEAPEATECTGGEGGESANESAAASETERVVDTAPVPPLGAPAESLVTVPVEPMGGADAGAPKPVTEPVPAFPTFDAPLPPVPAAVPTWASPHGFSLDMPHRASRWRWLLGIGTGVLLLMLLLQAVLHARDALSAQHPLLRPWLVALCNTLGCQVQPLRLADVLVIESSAFQRVRGNVYRLSFTVRNRSDVPVARPAVELSLTDRQDAVLLRRVWTPQELAGAAGILPPRGEWVGEHLVHIAGRASEREGGDSAGTEPGDPAIAAGSTGAAFDLDRMSGYTVGVFYP